MKRVTAVVAMLFAICLFMAGCSSSSDDSNSSETSASVHNSAGSWDAEGKPVNGGPKGSDGSTGNNLTKDYCAHNKDAKCPTGTYFGVHVAAHATSGSWDANGNPVNGGPTGADGSTGNNKTQEYCARNQDPACPKNSYVAANAIKNPDGSHSYVKCEGTICTNPNHGGGEGTGAWDANGKAVNGGPQGADGSTGNNQSQQYCAQNQDPGCPQGSYVAPNAIKSPDGNNRYVPCEGTICTNPNQGAGDDTPITEAPAEAPAPAPETDDAPGDDIPTTTDAPDGGDGG